MPTLYVVAGPNGAGKTTAFNSLIPAEVDYINADLVAKTVREQAGGLNVQDIANHEVSKIFYEKLGKKSRLLLRPTFAIWILISHLWVFRLFRL